MTLFPSAPEDASDQQILVHLGLRDELLNGEIFCT